MNRPRRDPCEILGVACDATEREVRKRYRKLCKQFHPDLNQGDPQAAEIFKEITWAYETMQARLKSDNTSVGTSEAFAGLQDHNGTSHPFIGFFQALRAYCVRLNPNKES